MTWAILGVGLFVIVVLVMGIVLIAVNVLKSSQSTAASLISFDQRAQQEREAHRQQVTGLIDRFLSGDWEAVRLHEGSKDTPWGGFISPEDQEEEELDLTTQVEPDEEPFVEQTRRSWGSASRERERADALDEAERLAQEDDIDNFDRERGVAR